MSVCLDRQEKVTEGSQHSAIQQVEIDFGFPVISIVNLGNLIAFMRTENADSLGKTTLAEIEQYRSRYGIVSGSSSNSL